MGFRAQGVPPGKEKVADSLLANLTRVYMLYFPDQSSKQGLIDLLTIDFWGGNVNHKKCHAILLDNCYEYNDGSPNRLIWWPA